MEKVTLELYLSKLAGARLVSPTQSTERKFQVLLKRFPENKHVFEQYAWFLYDNGQWEDALIAARKATEIDPLMVSPRFCLGFTYSKLGRYDEAIPEFLDLFAHLDPRHSPESPYMYFNFLLLLKCGFDYDGAEALLEGLLKDHPELTANGTDVFLRNLNANRVKQIYQLKKNTSGFLLFIDLVGSTQYKYDFPELWQERIIHFLMYTKYAMKTIDFDFIKFIGDEVMMFRPFGTKSKSQVAQEIYSFFGARQDWYSSEINRFNPSLKNVEDKANSPHRIKVKITIGEVTDAKLFSPYYNEVYDLIGEDVDRIARIKELGYENLWIADQGYVEALALNGSGFETPFSKMVWQQKFKGIQDSVKFFGKLLST